MEKRKMFWAIKEKDKTFGEGKFQVFVKEKEDEGRKAGKIFGGGKIFVRQGEVHRESLKKSIWKAESEKAKTFQTARFLSQKLSR